MKVCKKCGSEHVSVAVWVNADAADAAMYGSFGELDVQEFVHNSKPLDCAHTVDERLYYCDNCDKCPGIVEYEDWYADECAKERTRRRVRKYLAVKKPRVNPDKEWGNKYIVLPEDKNVPNL